MSLYELSGNSLTLLTGAAVFVARNWPVMTELNARSIRRLFSHIPVPSGGVMILSGAYNTARASVHAASSLRIPFNRNSPETFYVLG